MLAMLTARNLPQTLLLPTLFLLVAVAAILLAGGPAGRRPSRKTEATPKNPETLTRRNRRNRRQSPRSLTPR